MAQPLSNSLHNTTTLAPGEVSSWGFLVAMQCRAFSVASTGVIGISVNGLDKPEMSVTVSANAPRTIELAPWMELKSIHVINQTDGAVTVNVTLL